MNYKTEDIEQRIITGKESYIELDNYLRETRVRCALLVCGKSIRLLDINNYFTTLEKRVGVRMVRFSDFKSNPSYDSVVAGIELFREEECDAIIAVGGGSALDVAKCIKLFANMKGDGKKGDYLRQTILKNSIRLIAIPTTAGTGSEATKFAVVYLDGEKQSVSDVGCVPSVVLMDAENLKSLPLYQRKSTMLDTFCHALESFWSIHSTGESRIYSQRAIRIVLENMEAYLSNERRGNEGMLMASNIAGKAINITQTTAGHAMCYKLTSLYEIAHGHAAALCIASLWPYMLAHMNKCIDPRGKEHLNAVFTDIAETMQCRLAEEAVEKFQQILKDLELKIPHVKNETDFEILTKSVNLGRLKNNPIVLNSNDVENLYYQILKK